MLMHSPTTTFRSSRIVARSDGNPECGVMRAIKYMPEQEIGSLVFLREHDSHISATRKSRVAVFRCRCGNEFMALIRSAITGNTKTCGCRTGLTPREKIRTTHGLSHHPIYRVYKSIKTRCNNQLRADYHRYGGRGISLSAEFSNDFPTFLKYVSELPGFNRRDLDDLTLDRIDNDIGYQRGNLRWATRAEQAANRGSA